VKMREAVDAAMGNVCVSVCAGSSIPRRGGESGGDEARTFQFSWCRRARR
jgi:hypothetical protein